MSNGQPMASGRVSALAGSGPLGRVVTGCLVYYVAAVVLLHFLRTDVSPAAQPTSDYAIGPYGFLMTSTFFVLSIALVALGIGLARSLATPARFPAGIVLLFLAATAVAVAGVFPNDVGAWKPVTPTGWVHRLAGAVAFPSMTLAPLLLSWRLRREPGWRDVTRLGAVVGSLGLLLVASVPLFLFERGLAGAAQRVALALVVVWMLVMARRMTGRASAESRTAG